MAVKVLTSLVSGAGDMVTHTHSEGADIVVNDGHLVVLKANTSTIAIYAPKQWLSAEVTPSQG